MSIVVREAVQGDIEKIIDLAVESVLYSHSPHRKTPLEESMGYRRRDLEKLHGLLDDPNVGIFAAYDNIYHSEEEIEEFFVGSVIVCTGLVEELCGEHQALVVDLSIKPDYYGTGIGKRLMDAAEAFAISKGLRYLTLEVTTTNERAEKFYEAFGFVEERKKMVKVLGE